MPTNFYFNNFPIDQITQEQLLVEDLVIEAMQIYGMDIFYLPRGTRDQVDYLYGEDPLKVFNKAHSIEMYLENVSGMDGEGDFISKFGLEIRDELTFLVSRRRFKFSTQSSNINRPREGDLIYIPMLKNFFEITFVEHENDQAMFYTLGRGRGGNVYVYALKLKQFVFSNEVIATGVSEIDSNIREYYPRTNITLTTGTGTFTNDEIVYQGTDLANANAQAIVYTSSLTGADKSLTVIRTQGQFVTGNVIGSSSDAVWNANVVSQLVEMDNAFDDLQDNNRFETEGNNILDWTEKNPFGEA